MQKIDGMCHYIGLRNTRSIHAISADTLTWYLGLIRGLPLGADEKLK